MINRAPASRRRYIRAVDTHSPAQRQACTRRRFTSSAGSRPDRFTIRSLASAFQRSVPIRSSLIMKKAHFPSRCSGTFHRQLFAVGARPIRKTYLLFPFPTLPPLSPTPLLIGGSPSGTFAIIALPAQPCPPAGMRSPGNPTARGRPSCAASAAGTAFRHADAPNRY